MKNLHAVLLSLCVLFGASEAWAQECVPSCRRGFLCVKATCVSACNPACGNGESCVDGDCIASQSAAAPTPAASTSPPPSPAPPAPQPYVPPQGDPPPAATEAVPPGTGGKAPYFHDGFFLQFGLGVGAVLGSAETDAFDVDVGGVALLSQLAVGGTLARGLVLGGGVFSANLFSTNYEAKPVGNANVSPIKVDGEGSSAAVIGPFMAYYPDPETGFFVMAAPGLAAVTASEGGKDGVKYFNEHKGTGLGLMAGLGYESFLAPQWSVGAMARVLYVSADIEDDDGDKAGFTGWVPGVLLTFSHH